MTTADLLFVTPVVPEPASIGIKMRAYWTLRALSAKHAVHMLVLAGGPVRHEPVSDEVRALCARVTRAPRRWSLDVAWFARNAMLRLPGLGSTAARAILAPFVRAEGVHSPLDAAWAAAGVFLSPPPRVHVFRMRALAGVVPLLWHPSRPAVDLDIDDIESVAAARNATLAEANGRADLAWFYRRVSRAWEALEARWIPRVARVWVCSAGDAAALRERFPSVDAQILPNVVHLPPACSGPGETRPYRLLFVGALGYYPNLQAAHFLVREVIPRLRARTSEPFRVIVAGRGAPAKLEGALRRTPEVDYRGPVPEMGPIYAEAHAVIVPLFAGGGTRIKIIEAFAHGRPVVTTPIGAEGLAARDGDHLLVAGDAEGLVAAVLRLMTDAALAERLQTNARRWVADHHGPDAMARALATPR